MYAVGAHVVHPCYGAGTIVRIQEKVIGERSTCYYVIRTQTPHAMQLMVPVERAEEVGLRRVGEAIKLRGILAGCEAAPVSGDITHDYRERQALMREELKSGRFGVVAESVRVLHFLSTRRALGTVDRGLFDQAKGLLAGELSLASGQAFDEAMTEIEDHLNQMLAEEE